MLEFLFSNIVTSALLALLAVAAARLRTSPQITHALWVLVLLKLVTPPLIPFSIELPGAVLELAITESILDTTAPQQTNSENADHRGKPPAVAQTRVLGNGPFLDSAPIFSIRQMAGRWGRSALILVWALGSLAFFSLVAYRGCVFHRTLLRARPAPETLQRSARRHQAHLGLHRCPRVLVVEARIPPLLWAYGWEKKIVLPAGLIRSLDSEGQSSLLAHELVHLRRRDHWVRLLEVAVSGLYWWNPLVWIARKKLQEAEELCCDARVLRLTSKEPERYASTLMDTVDFLCGAPLPFPASGMGNGSARSLERRLKMILQQNGFVEASRLGKVLILALALTALPLAAARPQPPASSVEPPPAQAQEEPSAEEIEKKVNEALSRLDMDRILKEALADVENALAEVDLERELSRAREQLDSVEIDQKVQEALRQARESLDEASIRLEIQRSLDEIDVELITRQALESARVALESADVEKQIREMLEQIDLETILEEALREVREAEGTAKKKPEA